MLGVLSAASPELPPAPEGFTWKQIEPVKATVLIPTGWHFKSQEGGSKRHYAISKENIDEKGSFETGLTFVVWQKVSTESQGPVPPSAYAAAMLQKFKELKTLERDQAGTQGPFQCVRYQYVDAPPGQTSIRVYNLLLANDKTGTLYIITFEGPTKEWEQAWALGSTILKNLRIDDEI